MERSPYTYLFLIIVWAVPVIVMQWLVGFDVFLKRWKVWIPSILIPTLWLTCVDGFAIGAKTWTIAPGQSLGIFIPIIHVPIEEGLFFLVTNTLVVQGLILFMHFRFMVRRWRIIASNALELMRRRRTPSDSSSVDTGAN